MNESTFILYADIPDLQIKKAIKTNCSDSLSSFISHVQKKAGTDLSSYGIFTKSEEGVLKEIGRLSDCSFDSLGMKDKDIVFFVKRREAEEAVIASFSSEKRSVGTKVNYAQQTKIFGISLEIVTQHFGHLLDAESNLPLFLVTALRHIEEKALKQEGIFRLSGHQTVVSQMREKIDKGDSVTFLSTVHDNHAIAGLIKLYLRELPEPLITFDVFEAMRWLSSKPLSYQSEINWPNGKIEINQLKILVHLLPASHYRLLKELITFLVRIAEHNDVNKMGFANLATVFGPNLMRPRIELPEELMMTASLSTMIVMQMLENCKLLFETPFSDCIFKAVALTLYDYERQNASEISFEADGYVFIAEKTEENGWWEGEYKGQRGLFPYNYVKTIGCHKQEEPANYNTNAAKVNKNLSFKDKLDFIKEKLDSNGKPVKEKELSKEPSFKDIKTVKKDSQEFSAAKKKLEEIKKEDLSVFKKEDAQFIKKTEKEDVQFIKKTEKEDISISKREDAQFIKKTEKEDVQFTKKTDGLASTPESVLFAIKTLQNEVECLREKTVQQDKCIVRLQERIFELELKSK